VARIIDYVSSNAFGQIFITDTNREHLDTILATTTNEYKLFHVSDGAIKEVTDHETPEC
jgi:DNA replication and repair protein RecF